MNQRQAKWALYLSRFDFTLKHIPEVRMKKADELNRRLDWKIGIENDNKNQKLIKEEWIWEIIEVMVEGPEEELKEKIKRVREKDKVVKVREEIKKIGVRNLRGDEWKIKGDSILKKGKIYITKNEKLRVEIIWLHHDMLVAGHKIDRR